jgi:hypothetical protein
MTSLSVKIKPVNRPFGNDRKRGGKESMSGPIRNLPGVMGKMITGFLLGNRAIGAMVLDAEEIVPGVLANKLPDPQLELAGAIMILFAGSLTILLIGYVSDSSRALYRS